MFTLQSKIAKTFWRTHPHRYFTEVSFLKPSPTLSAKQYGQPTFETHSHLIKSGEFVPGIKLSEIQGRRESLAKSILERSGQKKHLVIIPGAQKKYMSGKIPYVFRQNSDFLYFSGNLEHDSCLVLEISEEKTTTTMFLRAKDRHTEMWDGPVTGIGNGSVFFGVDAAVDINELGNYINLACKSTNPDVIWYNREESEQSVLNKVLDELNPFKPVQSPTNFIHRLRLVKSSAEQALMRQTCQIASEAINSTVKWSKPGMSEHHLFAKVDYECRMRGASFLAYPPVVAGGSNATIIHYINNCQTVAAGEMILMDAGCEFASYTSDITRTFPIGGRFTDPQRVLYEIVLNTQKDIIRIIAEGKELSLDQLFEIMCLQLGKYLKEIGFIPKHISAMELARAAYKFCPHHVSHYLGMDVHDTSSIPRSLPLSEGMTFTIEPGIYIGNDRRDLPDEYRNIGIRIEDDALINNGGQIEILTSACLKEINEIEQ